MKKKEFLPLVTPDFKHLKSKQVMTEEKVREIVAKVLAEYVVLGHVRPNILNPSGYYFASGRIVPYQEINKLNDELKK